jgi:hypothetical protein
LPRRPQLWAALISFLYLDLLDCTGTCYSMAVYINKREPGFIDPVTKAFPGMTMAFAVDASAIWIGALMGIPPLTVYIESATGVNDGGRTGLTAIMIGIYFGCASARVACRFGEHHGCTCASLPLAATCCELSTSHAVATQHCDVLRAHHLVHPALRHRPRPHPRRRADD